MIFLAIILTALFTNALAHMQGPTVAHIEERGAPPFVYDALHQFGAYTKFFFLVAVASVVFCWHFHAGLGEAIKRGIGSGLICFFAMWALFDPMLNKARPEGLPRSWDYISINDSDGKRWIRWFGEKAGRIKAYILTTVTCLLTLIYKLFL
jgi:hypothetical protein